MASGGRVTSSIRPLRLVDASQETKAMTDKQSQVPLSAIALFAEHPTEMLDELRDVPEFKKRHGASLIRLRDGIAKLLDS